MKILALILGGFGIWFVWSAEQIYRESHHMGSLFFHSELQQHRLAQSALPEKERAALVADQEEVLAEGQLTSSLLQRSLGLVGFSGCALIATAAVVFYRSLKKEPNQAPDPTPPSGAGHL